MKNILKSIPKYFALASFALLPSGEDRIEIRQGLGFEYNVSFKKGVYQISKIAANSFGEDSFFWDGRKFIDVGVKSGDTFVVVRTSFVKEKMTNPEKSFLFHPHPYFAFDRKRSIRPPSDSDFFNCSKYNEMNLKNLAVVDSSGVWKYWTDSTFENKTDSLFVKYNQNMKRFFARQKFSKSTSLEEQLEDFESDVKALGFNLKYEKF